MPCYLVVLIPVNRQKKYSSSFQCQKQQRQKAKNYAVCLDYYWSKQILKRLIVYESKRKINIKKIER